MGLILGWVTWSWVSLSSNDFSLFRCVSPELSFDIYIWRKLHMKVNIKGGLQHELCILKSKRLFVLAIEF